MSFFFSSRSSRNRNNNKNHCFDYYSRPIIARMYTIVLQLLAVLIAIQQQQLFVVSGYKIGDTIDTDLIKNNYNKQDIIRSLRPKYGIYKTISIDIDLTHTNTISFSFEDNLFIIPTYPIVRNQQKVNGGDLLDTITISFVYSTGIIHSVTSEVIYSRPNNNDNNNNNIHTIIVEYKWIEEPIVNLIGGFSIMYLITFFATLYLLLVSCRCMDDGNNNTNNNPYDRSNNDNNNSRYYQHSSTADSYSSSKNGQQQYGGYRGSDVSALSSSLPKLE